MFRASMALLADLAPYIMASHAVALSVSAFRLVLLPGRNAGNPRFSLWNRKVSTHLGGFTGALLT